MSVEEAGKVDIIMRRDDGAVTLLITDHLHLGDKAHLLSLEEKLNTYLAFIESGQIADHAPEGARVGIEIALMHEPDREGREFLMKAGEVTGRAGYPLTFRVRGDA